MEHRRFPAKVHRNFLKRKKIKQKLFNAHFTEVNYTGEDNFFFLSGFSFTDTDDSQDSRGREGTIFYSTLPIPPAHEHSDIYLQLCT